MVFGREMLFVSQFLDYAWGLRLKYCKLCFCRSWLHSSKHLAALFEFAKASQSGCSHELLVVFAF